MENSSKPRLLRIQGLYNPRLNNRLRKCLGYRTPNEVFFSKSFVALAT
jgi:IS30 family transposase